MPSIKTAMEYVEKARTAEERKVAHEWLKKALALGKKTSGKKSAGKKKAKK